MPIFYQVRVLDLLVPQVHGNGTAQYLNPKAEFIHGDVCDAGTVQRALDGVDAVFHEAAEVGVGQSMYEIDRYVRANDLGTGVLLQQVIAAKDRIKKLVVASSMSIYGEGAYSCPKCGEVYPQLRPSEQLLARRWEVECPECGSALEPIGTKEEKPLFPTSVYAITKQDQEQFCLVVGRAYRIPTVALRYFNVYGPRQALSNPYTGVCAIFSARLLNNQPPVIFEDGGQTRDFVHVSDIVQANLLALEKSKANYEVFNVGTGRASSILHVAATMSKLLKFEKPPTIVNEFREGDIRHCFADITKISKALGYKPRVSFEDGMRELIGWIQTQTASDQVEKATNELRKRGLI